MIRLLLLPSPGSTHSSRLEVLATETYPQLGLTRELPQAANFVMLSALAAVQAGTIFKASTPEFVFGRLRHS